MITDINTLVRENIKNLQSYSSARHEHQGEAGIFLDANENPYGSPGGQPLNRYPDPLQTALKEKISAVKGVPPANIFLGNGSDEAIDLLIRVFCEPARDNLIIMTPTYGMFSVCAAINNVTVKNVPLTNSFQPDLEALENAIDAHTRMIFICSPNNPTGNSMNRNDVETIIANFDGIVVIDEAYINFARQKTFISELTEFPNLVILQTFSKAWGLAGARVGMAFAGKPIIDLLDKIRFPYNINELSLQAVSAALDHTVQVNAWIAETVSWRDQLALALAEFPFVETVYPSDASFLLVKVNNAGRLYSYLRENGIIVRDRSSIPGCEECLRISTGTPAENSFLLNTLKSYAR